MTTPQGAILPETGTHGLFLSLEVTGDTPSVLSRCADLNRLTTSLKNAQQDTSLHASVAFGSRFWETISTTKPAQLKAFPVRDGAHKAVSTPTDVLVHIHCDRADLVFELGRKFLGSIQDQVSVTEDIKGFRYLEARDLTGFVDGTENPEGEDRAEVALVGQEEPGFEGGSYVIVQRYVHNLSKWSKLTDNEQEKVFGRTKPDSIELEEDKLPNNAHIARVVIEEAGEELEIVRHSMPYGEVSGDAGLVFIGYSCDLSIFEKMLTRMFGDPNAPSEPTDRLLDFTNAVSGAYFFAPSQELLETLAKAG